MTRSPLSIFGLSLAVTLGAWIGSAEAAPYLLSSATVDPGVSSATNNFQQSFASPTDSGLVSVTQSGFTGSARSITDFTQIKNYATVSLTGYSSGTYGFNNAVQADSYVSDTFTITGGTGNAYLQLVFTVDGSTTLSGDLGLLNGPFAQETLSIFTAAFPPGPLGVPVNSWGITSSTVLTSVLIPFTYSVPFDLTITSSAFAGPADTGGPYTYDFSGTADFGSTIDLSSLKVYSDPTGQAQVGFRLESGSGSAYPLATVPTGSVPEPGTLWLVAAGLLGLLGARRRFGRA